MDAKDVNIGGLSTDGSGGSRTDLSGSVLNEEFVAWSEMETAEEQDYLVDGEGLASSSGCRASRRSTAGAAVLTTSLGRGSPLASPARQLPPHRPLHSQKAHQLD